MSYDDTDPEVSRGTAPRRRPTSSRVPPHDLDAERSVIGAALLQPRTVLDEAARDLVPGDFYSPVHQYVWQILVDMRRHGDPIDTVTVADRARRDGREDEVSTSTLLEAQAATPAISNAARYAATVGDHSVARRLIAAASEIQEHAYGQTAFDSTELLDRARTVISGIAPARPTMPLDLTSVEDFSQFVEANPRPWVVPDLIKRRWRTMVVAGEGAGKAVLLRQIALCVSQGMHPFSTATTVPAQRTLYVDLENPPEAIEFQMRLSRSVIERRRGGWIPESAFLLARESGMNLRTRRDQAELEAVVDAVRPAILVIGPIYKAFRKGANEDYASAALAAQEFIDDLRVRYDCAVLLEAHAPKGNGATRDLEPEGSAVWMHWPEFGLTMVPAGPKEDKRSVMRIGRFRADRLVASWPTSISRARFPDQELPWCGLWADRKAPAGDTARPVEEPF